MGIEQSIYMPSTLQIVLLCVHAPTGLFRVPFLPHPPPLNDLYPAALLRMHGNYFRPYLSIFVCAIELQHNNENSTTIHCTKSLDDNYLHSVTSTISALVSSFLSALESYKMISYNYVSKNCNTKSVYHPRLFRLIGRKTQTAYLSICFICLLPPADK